MRGIRCIHVSASVLGVLKANVDQKEGFLQKIRWYGRVNVEHFKVVYIDLDTGSTMVRYLDGPWPVLPT